MTSLVVALGGNALMRRGEAGSMEVQRRNLARAARPLVELLARGHRLVLTHGNGPQVGYLAIEADAARDLVPPPPLDVLVAESQGQIGYLVAEALTAEIRRRGLDAEVVTLLTRTVVDPSDAAFLRPSKPVGPVYDEATATRLAGEHGWTVAPDGAGLRRVVASPEPIEIPEALVIRELARAGRVVVASGGGGIPVRRTDDGGLAGVEAVVDKDLAAVILAEVVGAEALLLLTDVDGVYRVWPSPSGGPLRDLSVNEARELLDAGSLAAGSMRPKVLAAMRFAAGTGCLAAIGALESAPDILDGLAGTAVRR